MISFFPDIATAPQAMPDRDETTSPHFEVRARARAAALVGVLSLVPLVEVSANTLVSSSTGPKVANANRLLAPPRDSLEEAARRIIEAEMREGQVYDLLVDLCDTAGHRLSGSAGADRAVRWGLQTFEEMGFATRRHSVMVPKWVRGEPERVELTAPYELSMAALALGGSIDTPENGIEAEVLLVEDAAELKRRASEARGRIVLFNKRMGPDGQGGYVSYGQAVGQRTRGAIEAAKVGAVASLIRSVGTADWRLPHTGTMRYEEGVKKIPHAAISTEDANLVERLIGEGEPVRIRMRLDCRSLGEVPSANVIGEFRGREKPHEVVVIGGHLDSWDVGQGAHDDGVGVVSCIEAIRLLKSLGLQPRRTIRVILFMNEENGVAGGRAYAKDFEEELPFHVAAVEMDSGGFQPLGFGVSAGDGGVELMQMLSPWLRGIEAPSITAGGGGVDIGPMRAFGVPIIGLKNDTTHYFDYHHTPADTPDKVNPIELKRCAAAMAVMAYTLAEMEEKLPRLPVSDR